MKTWRSQDSCLWSEGHVPHPCSKAASAAQSSLGPLDKLHPLRRAYPSAANRGDTCGQDDQHGRGRFRHDFNHAKQLVLPLTGAADVIPGTCRPRISGAIHLADILVRKHRKAVIRLTRSPIDVSYGSPLIHVQSPSCPSSVNPINNPLGTPPKSPKVLKTHAFSAASFIVTGVLPA